MVLRNLDRNSSDTRAATAESLDPDSPELDRASRAQERKRRTAPINVRDEEAVGRTDRGADQKKAEPPKPKFAADVYHGATTRGRNLPDD